MIFLVVWVAYFSLAVVGGGTEPTYHPLPPGQGMFINKTSSNSFPPQPDIFCYQGKETRPWHVWRTVELFIAFSPKSTDKDEFEYFVADTVAGAFDEWKKAQEQTTPIYTWFSQLLLKLPVKLLFSSSGSGNSTLDRLLFWAAPSSISLNPFQSCCIAISSVKSYTATLHVAAISPSLVIGTFLGVALFLTAPILVSADVFYYVSGTGLGVISCALVAVFLLFRYLPMRRPFVVSVTIVGSSALWVGMARRILDFLSEHLYIAAICIIVAACIGFAVSYWYGPPESPRVKHLISWFLQGVGLVLIVMSTFNIPLISAAITLLCLGYHNRHRFAIPLKVRLMVWRVFPFHRKLLTLDEYEREGREETKRQIDALRSFVNSPQCDTWGLVRKLKDPVKFAKFVSPLSTPVANGNSQHTQLYDDSDNDSVELELEESSAEEDYISSDED